MMTFQYSEYCLIQFKISNNGLHTVWARGELAENKSRRFWQQGGWTFDNHSSRAECCSDWKVYLGSLVNSTTQRCLDVSSRNAITRAAMQNI